MTVGDEAPQARTSLATITNDADVYAASSSAAPRHAHSASPVPSPEARIAQLSGRMSRAHEQLLQQEGDMRRVLAKKLQCIVQGADRAVAADAEHAKTLQGVLTSLRATHEKQVVGRELCEMRTAERLKDVTARANQRIKATQQKLESGGQALLEGIERRFGALEEMVASGLCTAEAEERHRQAEERIRSVERQLPARSEGMQRKVTDFGVAVDTELRRVEHYVQAEVQAGQQLEETVRQQLEDVRCRLRRAVHLERLAREKSEESFLQSIEAACPSAERRS